MAIDFSKRYKDYARFTPAVSEMFVRFIASKTPKRVCPVPQKDLDFLDPTSGLYYLPYVLYSAGQAAKSKNKAVLSRQDMMTARNRAHSTLIGDSGGYQIQTNVIKFEGDPTRERMLRWLEAHCDWSMILDFPTGGIGSGNVDQHTVRLNKELAENPYMFNHDNNPVLINSVDQFCNIIGYHAHDINSLGYATCMLQTLINNEYFLKHRVPGATKFMNVIQGRNAEESDLWYKYFKHFSTANDTTNITGFKERYLTDNKPMADADSRAFEGWSFAGHHKENFEMTMRRLIDLREDGFLEKSNWLHFLGVGKLANGCAYTTMQRYIRENINPNFTISYDVSSPFTTTAYGNLFMGYTLDKAGWTMQSGWVDGHEYLPGEPKGKIPFLEELKKVWDKKKLSPVDQGGNSHFIETEVGKKLLMEDICINADPKFTSTWDVVTYALLMHHNLQVHLEGVFESQDRYDHGDAEHVPYGLLLFRDLIPEIFSKPYHEAMALITRSAKDLNFLAGEGANGGVMDCTQFAMAPNSQHNKAMDQVRELIAPTIKEMQKVESGLFEGL